MLKIIKRWFDTIFVLCLDIISNLILATLKEEGKEEGVSECEKEGLEKAEGRKGGVLANATLKGIIRVITNN